jgi:hypothetical protein
MFEMKSGKSPVERAQIEAYLKVSKELKIPRLISISNQYVPIPTSYPIEVTKEKSVDLYHFSWSYIITLARILLFDNDLNISDPDQVNIMREVVSYLEHPEVGTRHFTQMGKYWKEAIEKIRIKSILKSDTCFDSAISDWIQEEQDITMRLSTRMGVLVSSQKKQFNSLQTRIEAEKKSLIEKHYLESEYSIPNAVSKMRLIADFDKRSIQLIVRINVPYDKKSSFSRLNWVFSQIEKCKKKSDEFKYIEPYINLQVNIKGRKENIMMKLVDSENLLPLVKDSEVISVDVEFRKDLAASFNASEKFIVILEKMVTDFYLVIVQNLKNWKRPAPKMVMSEQIDEGKREKPYASEIPDELVENDPNLGVLA